MNVIEFSIPAPCCLIPITHPARAVERVPDVARTFKNYMVTDLKNVICDVGENSTCKIILKV
jgi:hypothetical protein